MKTLTTLVAAAALIGGVTIAGAQNAPTTTPNPSPNSINKGSLSTKPSGSESQSTAHMGSAKMANRRTTGHSKFCVETSPGGSLNCKFASMKACEKAGQPNNLNCVVNPNVGTTGSK
jgi:hypothetical protein